MKWRRVVLYDLTGLLIASLAIRLLLFSGWGLGDDFLYSEFVNRILTDGYPNDPGAHVFLVRPLLLYAMASCVKTFGWSEFSFVLPFLLASLIGIASTYVLGARLGGRGVGLLSATALSLFPLDWVNSTTMTNDILGSALLASGAVLIVVGLEGWPSFRWLGGLVMGLATWVKLDFAISILPLAICLLVLVYRKRVEIRPAASVAIGWLASQLGLALFSLLLFGQPFAPWRVELEFNAGMAERDYPADVISSALLYYPRLIFGLRPAGVYGHEVFPLGYFFLLSLIGASWLWISRARVPYAWIPILCLAIALLVMEFWPIQLTPYYAPIHRLPRFLHIAAVPGAITIGVFLSTLFGSRELTKVAAGGAILLVYAVSCVQTAMSASQYHDSCMSDPRKTAEILEWFDGLIVTDIEMRNYLLFHDQFVAPHRYLLDARAVAPAGAVAVVGGSRRPEIGAQYSAEMAPGETPPGWLRVSLNDDRNRCATMPESIYVLGYSPP